MHQRWKLLYICCILQVLIVVSVMLSTLKSFDDYYYYSGSAFTVIPYLLSSNTTKTKEDSFSVSDPDIIIEDDLASLQQKWYNIFYDQFIMKHIISIQDNENIDDEQIHQLLLDTSISFNHRSFNFSSYKQLIAIRRYVMILNRYNIIDTSDANSSISVQYSSLISIFISYHRQFIESNEFYKYFLIHVSKSAGTSLCITASKYLEYNPERAMKTNCNLPHFFTAIKKDDDRFYSCKTVESLAEATNYSFFAREKPLHSPQICNEFLYILPMRHIAKRIASNLAEWNNFHMFPFQFLYKYASIEIQDDNDTALTIYKQNMKRKYELMCLEQIIALKDEHIYSSNGSTIYHIYSSPTNGHHFDTFISELFHHENITTMESNFTMMNDSLAGCEHKKSLGVVDEEHFVLQWLDNKAYGKYMIKIPADIKYRSNIDLIRGYASNIYTRFIGYHEHKNMAYEALYAKSHEITMEHWLNAVRFIMKVDYILPFEDVSKIHEIWHHSYLDAQRFAPAPYKNRARRFAKRKWNKAAISEDGGRNNFKSMSVVDGWSEKDWKVIRSHNKWDDLLLNLAYIIADVDVKIYNKV